MEIPGLPQIPTDNLYKFQAVTGVIIATVGLVLFGWLAVQREGVSVETEKQVELLELTAARFTKAAERERELLERKTASPETLMRQAQIVDSLSVLTSRMLDARRADLAADRRRLQSERDFTFVAAFLFAIGALWSMYAFNQWHQKHQVFQDRLLIAEVERAELEVGRLRGQSAFAAPE
jgi:hypothetical protein